MKKIKILFILIVFVLSKNNGFSQVNKIFDFNSSAIGLNPMTKVLSIGDFIFGTTKDGGANNYGVIFKLTKSGMGYTIIHSFDSINGAYPIGNIYVKGDYIFGITEKGGENNFGVVFKIKNDGSDFKVVFNNPVGFTINNFIIVDSVLYGSTYFNLIKVGIDGTNFVQLSSNLMVYGLTISFEKDSFLYCTAHDGGLTNNGAIFRIKTDGSDFTKLIDFNRESSGSYPRDIFVLNNKIYGIANQGGVNNDGTIFSLDFTGNNFSVIFNGSYMNPTYFNHMTQYNNKLYCTTETGFLFKIDTNGQNTQVIEFYNGWDSIFYQPSVIDSSLFSFVYSPSRSFPFFLVKYDIDESATEINEISTNSLLIFPNPSTTEIVINNISQNAIISIYDLNGKMVITKIAKSLVEKIDVSNLANGLYSIHVIANNMRQTNKFIKQ